MTHCVRAQSSRILLSAVALAFASTVSFGSLRAEDKIELPKSGSLSVSGSGGQANVAVAGGWGDSDGLGGGQAPVSGSVSRLNPSTWQLFVQNSSDDTYSVNLEVVQKDDRGTRVKGDSFSYTLKPRAQARRTLSAVATSTSAELNLRNWRNVSKQKADREKAKSAGVAPTAAPGSGANAPVPGSN